MDYVYEQETRRLAPGDTLIIFTDGISEAMNVDGDLYGLERLRQQSASKGANAAIVGRQILDDVRRFVGGRAE